MRPGVVREPILASWIRSRDYRVSAEPFELPYEAAPARADLLTDSANKIMAEVGEQFSGESVSLILTDDEGVVLERRTGDSKLQSHLDRVSLAPGFSYAERFAGTNGIGTALQGKAPAQVFGHEHYVEHLEELACAGAPIHHPTSGKVLGVVDLTCWRADANQVMVTAASSIARSIEEALLDRTGRREQALLQDYLRTCQRSRGPVVALGHDLVMLNDAARALIDPRDQLTLLGLATDALATGKVTQFDCPLPTGVTARVQCRPSWSDASVIGGVVQVRLSAAETLPAGPAAPPALPAPRGVLPGMVGSGALWTKCRNEVGRHFRSGEWLMLEGEPGTGKLTVARATHLANTPGGHLRVFDADTAPTDPTWLDSVREEVLEARGTLILRHVDRLADDTLDALTDLLVGADRPWVVATRQATGPASAPTGQGWPAAREDSAALERFAARFPRSVRVPPLRHHIDDVRELVPFLLGRLTRRSGLRCSPEAMRILLRNRWPGNVEQLYQVLRKIVAQRRTGVITPTDLPAEVQATSRRVLTTLESLECDAIIACLRGLDGNRAEAARHLGMSRATIYRKIRDYGIAIPATKA